MDKSLGKKGAEYTQIAHILIVDDEELNIISLEAILKTSEVGIVRALSGEEGLLQLERKDIALILLDVNMPGLNGFETAKLIKSNPATRFIPIIFITAFSEERPTLFKGYESGAVDFLFKPIESEILKSKVDVFLELYRQRKIIETQNESLNKANKKILDQQQSIIEEERLKVVLQMAGAAAHELNLPLLGLIGSLEILENSNFDPDLVKEKASGIKSAARKLSGTVKKIQTLDDYKAKQYDTAFIPEIEKEIDILYVADDEKSFVNLQKMLKDSKVKVSGANSISSGNFQLREKNFDIIFLKFSVEGLKGVEIIREIDFDHSKPVIFFVEKKWEASAAKMFAHTDFIHISTKVLNRDLLLGVIKSSLEKIRFQNDINSALAKMAALSTHDELTGLYNRRYMNEVLEQEFRRSVRYRSNLSCILLDLDLFKQVNDTFGHACGDFVLTEFAARIIGNKRETDYAFRYGGEEFLMLLPETDADGAYIAGENILKECREHKYIFEDNSFIVTVSMGISDLFDSNPEKGRDLISFADKALYRAKAEGRDRICIFERDSKENNKSRFFNKGKGLKYFKDQIGEILIKTKTAAENSIDQLILNAGGEQLEEETKQIKNYISIFCKKLGLPETISSKIKQAASLNSCFKMVLGDEILSKKNRLSDEDRRKIEKLPYLQIELANQFELFSEEKTILLNNHEWYNGKGYPEGLKADEIPIGAKILSIANSMVAMTSDRAFRKKISGEDAVSEIVKNAGIQFDPHLVGSFLDTMVENNILNLSEEKINSLKEKLKEVKP